MQIKEILMKSGIYNAGVKDKHGIMHNAYVVKGKKTAVIDSVPEEYAEDFIKNLSEITDTVDYYICNHSCPGYSGGLKALIELYPEITVTGSTAALRNLKEITNVPFTEQLAKNDGTVSLGEKTLRFIITPNLCWPDTMMTYLAEDGVLFPCRMFGADYCGEGDSKTYTDALKSYFDEIIKPFGGFAKKALEKIKTLSVNAICPADGIAAANTSDIIAAYDGFLADSTPDKKTLAVFYASEYGYTGEMADIAAKTAKESGFEVSVFDVNTDDEKAMSYALDTADAFAFGANTVNQKAPEKMIRLIAGADVIRRRGTPCMVFGSYGWSGEALTIIYSYLETMKLRPFDKPFKTIFRLSEQEKEEFAEYTRRFLRSTF